MRYRHHHIGCTFPAGVVVTGHFGVVGGDLGMGGSAECPAGRYCTLEALASCITMDTQTSHTLHIHPTHPYKEQPSLPFSFFLSFVIENLLTLASV